jgi:hypothetical protein
MIDELPQNNKYEWRTWCSGLDSNLRTPTGKDVEAKSSRVISLRYRYL